MFSFPKTQNNLHVFQNQNIVCRSAVQKNIHHSQQFSVLGQISNFYIFLKSNLELNYVLNPCAAPSHLLQMYKT